jgi:hypothetical protein
MRIRRRSAIVLASVAACGVGLIAFPASAAATPPVVPECPFPNTPGSDSCGTLRLAGLGALPNPGIQAQYENVRLGVRVRSQFQPPSSETTSVHLRFTSVIALNLSAVTHPGHHVPCPASELAGKTIAQAWEQCGPGADTTPASEGNAYLSTGLGPNVSGIASTVPPSDIPGCTMVFKGADNTHVTIYARFPIPTATTTGCNNPQTNTAGSATFLFTGTLSHQPPASPYHWTLNVPNTHTANPALDDFYATLVRGAAFRARCPSPPFIHKMWGRWTYTAVGDDPDFPGAPAGNSIPVAEEPCP